MARLTKEQILSLTPSDIERMRRTNLTQLKQITSDLQAINRKSYIRSKASGIESPFVSAYERSGGPASLKSFRGSVNESAQVKAEFESQLSLLQAKTRTFKGAKNVYKEMVDLMDPSHKTFSPEMDEMDKEKISAFWQLYRRLKEAHALVQGDNKDTSPLAVVRDIISSSIDMNKSFDEMLADVEEKYNKRYQEVESGDDYSENPFIFEEDEF